MVEICRALDTDHLSCLGDLLLRGGYCNDRSFGLTKATAVIFSRLCFSRKRQINVDMSARSVYVCTMECYHGHTSPCMTLQGTRLWKDTVAGGSRL